MTVRRSVLIGMLIAAAALSGAGQTSANDRADRSELLQLVISSSRERIRLGESFVLSVRLVNTSREKVWLYGRLLWGEGGGLTLLVEDEKGQVVHSAELDDDMVVPSTLFTSESFVVLVPGHFLGVERPDRQANLFPRAGKYRISVKYQSPVPGKYKRATNFWSREKGLIRSAPIWMEVAEQ